MVRDKPVLTRLTRVLPVVLMVLAAVLAKADTSSVFSLDGRSDPSSKDLYAPTLEVGDLLQVSTVRRQRIWHQSGRFLRDTFLPVASPV